MVESRIMARFFAVLALALLGAAPACANTYAISLFQGGTGTGSGSFTFTNGGSSGAAISPSVTTNVSSSPDIGVITFTSGGTGLIATVVAVDFSDGKTPPNRITGSFVEGVTGSLTVNGPFPGVSGCTGVGNGCVATLTFTYSGCCAVNQNPSTASKGYSIVLVDKNNHTQATVTGTYAVTDTVNSAPEPGALALIGIGLATLAWATSLRRTRGTGN